MKLEAPDDNNIDKGHVYTMYLKECEIDSYLLSFMQKECFNKKIEAAKVISSIELQQLLNTDLRFSDNRLVMKWWWIFDTKYTVIEKNVLIKILNQLIDINNVWTITAIVQAVTGLNCGFVGRGRKIENDIVTEEEVEVYGFLVAENDTVKLLVFDKNNNKVKEGEAVIGFVVFD